MSECLREGRILKGGRIYLKWLYMDGGIMDNPCLPENRNKCELRFHASIQKIVTLLTT